MELHCPKCGYPYTPGFHEKACELLADEKKINNLTNNLLHELNEKIGFDKCRGQTFMVIINAITGNAGMSRVDNIDSFRAKLPKSTRKKYDRFKKKETAEALICLVFIEAGPDEYYPAIYSA